MKGCLGNCCCSFAFSGISKQWSLFPNLWLANYSETPITQLLGKFYFTFKGEQNVFSENLETLMIS